MLKMKDENNNSVESTVVDITAAGAPRIEEIKEAPIEVDLTIEPEEDNASISDWSIIKNLASLVFASENRVRITAAMFLSIIHTGLILLTSYLISKVFKSIGDGESQPILNKTLTPTELLVLTAVLSFFILQLPALRNQLMAPVTAHNTAVLIKKGTEHLLHRSLQYHTSTPVSKSIFIIQKGFVISPPTTLVLTEIVPMLLQISVASAFLSIKYDALIGLSLPSLLLAQLLYCAFTSRWVLDINLKLISSENKVWDHFVGALNIYKLIHDSNQLERVLTELGGTLQARSNAFVRSVSLPLIISYGQIGLAYLHFGLASIYVARGVSTSRFTIEDFYIIFSYLLQQAALSPQFAQATTLISGAYPDIRYLFNELAKPYEIVDSHPDIPFPATENTPPQLEFRNVAFSYPPKKKGDTTHPIFTDLSFEIKPGTITALVSNSGTGKTTAFKLLYDYCRPQKGEILINGKNISEFSRKALQEHIIMVGQNPVLFKGSIRDNILFGTQHPKDVTDDDIYGLARKIHLEEFLRALPGQLDQDVGDGGNQLSGGERQRVAILRGLMKYSAEKPLIFCLDEATAALDAENAEKILKNLLSSFPNATFLMITHKLKEARFADTIIVLEKGKVVAKGKHNQLILTSPLYGRLWEAQQTASGQIEQHHRFFQRTVKNTDRMNPPALVATQLHSA